MRKSLMIVVTRALALGLAELRSVSYISWHILVLSLSFLAATSPSALCEPVVLSKQTPIKFRLLDTASSARNHSGDHLKFQLVNAVTTWSGRLLISKMAVACGSVTRAKLPWYLGKPGELRIKIESIGAVDDSVVMINAEFQVNGVPTTLPQNGTPTMSVERGGQAEYPEGTEFTAMLKQDVTIDPDKNPDKTKVRENLEIYPSDVDDIVKAVRARMDASPELALRARNSVIAVAPFDLASVTARSPANDVVEDVTTSLVKSQFKVVERAQLKAVLKELRLQHSGLVDPDTAKRVGQLTGADLLLVGSVSDRGKLIVANVRVLETATANCLVAYRAEIPYGPGLR